MLKRAAAIVLLALVPALGGGGCRASHRAPPRSDRPNIFLVVIDTLRLDRLGCYGRAPTNSPNLDRFARDAAVYRRAYAQSSWTKTSVASLMTGLYPYRHQVFTERAESQLPQSAITLAERLRDVGYRTIAASANPHVSKNSGFRQGFEIFASQQSWDFHQDEGFTRAVIQQLNLIPRDRPLFLYVHYLDPHDPWRLREPCRERLSATGSRIHNPSVLAGQAFVLSGESSVADLIGSTETPKPLPLSPVEKEHLQGLYDCEVSAVDTAVGELLTYLRDSRWLQGSLVVVTSDHGEEFWEHGMMRHGYQVFEETVRVPLIVKPPPTRKLAADHLDRPVELVDIAATVYDLLGIESTADDGTSLFAAAPRGASSSSSSAFGVTRFRNRHQAYLVEDQQKIIYDFTRGECHLFDLAADPGEEHPVDCQASDSGRRMLATLTTMKEDQSHAALEPDAPGDIGGADDALLRQRLKELGYVQ